MECPNCHNEMNRIDGTVGFQVVDVVAGKAVEAYQCRFCLKGYLLKAELIEITDPFPLAASSFFNSPYEEIVKETRVCFKIT